MIKRMNKKAEDTFTSEVLKMILAVIGISILLFLGYKLYTLMLKKTAIEQARETIDQLEAKINILKDGENSSFLMTGPDSWFLMFFNEKDVMPKECISGKGCICICQTQNALGCDKQGVCKRLELSGEMSYSCMSESSFDISNQYKCLIIKIKEIPLKKENGILLIGPTQNFETVNKLRSILGVDYESKNKNIEQLLAEFLLNQDNSLRQDIDVFMIKYVKENFNEVSGWYLTIKLNGETQGTFGYYPTSAGDMPETPSFKHSYDEIHEYSGKKYSFKWEFNLKKEI